MKRILSLFLVLSIIFCLIFQCSFESSAIAGVDDIVVLGVCLDLLAMGISIRSVTNFCQSQAFNDFCTDLGNHVDSGITAVKRGGKLFVATAKLAWQDLTGWVKDNFTAGQKNKHIDIDYEEESTPTTITLSDGMVLPYALFMVSPFFIYKTGTHPQTYHAWVCNGSDVGAYFLQTTIQILCLKTGSASPRVFHYTIAENGSDWTLSNDYAMTSGANYLNTSNGYVYNINYGSTAHMDNMSIYLYRTMNKIIDRQGTVDPDAPVAQNPPASTEEETYTIVADSNADFYPGAVNAPVETIQEGEKILIEVPEECIENTDPANPTITTDRSIIGETISTLTSAGVNPRVETNTYVNSGTAVDDIVDNTPEAELDGTNSGSAETDIEVANKFRLPRSFLEGFPFSIPYSIYVGIQSLIADPVAPEFIIPFSIPRLGIQENMVVDLTQWNPVARLCRALLSLVWVAGLAMACNKFIKR